MEISKLYYSNLVTIITLIGLLSTVCPFVSLHMIFLDESHSTLIATKWLFSYRRNKQWLL